MLNGENPQSSVEPSRCLSMYFAAATNWSQTSLRRFCSRALCDNTADIGHLRSPIVAIPQVLAYELIGGFAVALTGHFHLEVAGVKLEKVFEEFLIRHVRMWIKSTSPPGQTSMPMFLRPSPKSDRGLDCQFYEEGQKVARSPRVTRIVAWRQPSFRKVHHHVCRPSRKARADVLLGFVDDIFLKLLARIPGQVAVERVKKIHH